MQGEINSLTARIISLLIAVFGGVGGGLRSCGLRRRLYTKASGQKRRKSEVLCIPQARRTSADTEGEGPGEIVHLRFEERQSDYQL